MTEFNATALIVDDEADICELIAMSFSSIGIECVEAYSVSDAIVQLQKQRFDLCITDLRLGDDNGFTLIAYVQEKFPNMPIAMMTAHGNVESAVEALKCGAFDFISKPFDLDGLRNIALGAIKAAQSSINENARSMLGESKVMKEIHLLIQKFGRSQAPVFIQGESGTGKELAARAIHAASPRKDGPFIAINCGAIPEHLVESEFFGYKKGSFTGADKDKVGLFQAANGGTLFLDEIADLPLSMQVKLLRAIQERAIRIVGGTEEQSIDVRIISATHKSLEQMVSEGLFRQDLFYRLNVINLSLPPLRARLEDLPALSVHILQKINKANQTQIKISPEAIIALRNYSFPGNVRELENILERACVLSDGVTLEADDLSFNCHGKVEDGLQHSKHISSNYLKSPDNNEHGIFTNDRKILEDGDLKQIEAPASKVDFDSLSNHLLSEIPVELGSIEDFLNALEKALINRMLQVTNQNKTQAAEKFGLTFRSFRHRIKKLGIED